MNYSTTVTTKILLLCDHALVIEGIKSLFQRTPEYEVIRTVATCDKAKERIRTDSPEVVLLNMNDNLAEVAGMVGCIREAGFTGKIILMVKNSASSDTYVAMTLESKVDGILLQTATTRELERCISKVIDGGHYLSPEWLKAIKGEQKGTREDVYCSTLLSSLSDTEKTILKLIAKKKTTNEIAEQLFNSPKTIENHRYRICRKLNLNGKNSLLTFVIENKNCFVEN
ncbi:response regulator transcription factor [Roseivirga sp. BDSF3-8]|uniref:response regulator transcription factor n=1 Tax=Roseivirga sp. BDSF3-8 TaxID=3241598 RepID=UPI00353269F6